MDLGSPTCSTEEMIDPVSNLFACYLFGCHGGRLYGPDSARFVPLWLHQEESDNSGEALFVQVRHVLRSCSPCGESLLQL